MKVLRWNVAVKLSVVAACLALLPVLVTSRALAQGSWPERSVTIVVPFPAGGNTDTMARLLAEHLTTKLGKGFIIDNRPTAAGVLATAQVAKADPDGYTLLFGTAVQLSILPILQSVTYDAKRDFALISILGAGPFVLGGRPGLPAKDVNDLIARAKAGPEKLNIAVNPRSISHLVAALFAKRAGISMVEVPYKGGGPAVTGLLASEIDLFFGNASELIQYSGGQLKLYAVSSAEPLASLPGVPTVASLFPGFVVTSWNGLIAPSGVPKAVIEKLALETMAAAREPSISKRLAALGIDPVGSTSAEFAATFERELPLYSQAVEAAGLKP